jgi:hypothetical protein
MSLMNDIFGPSRVDTILPEASGAEKKVLNVGGGSKATAIPSYFDGGQHHLLDIDPRGEPDIVCDARQLQDLPGGTYDAVYCSHNLEHYYRHDGIKVLSGFLHMLSTNGFAEIRVPDISQVITLIHEQKMDLDDVIYTSPAGPISAHDVIYGLQTEIERSGKDFYAHKTGFTRTSLSNMLLDGGFRKVFVTSEPYLAVHALAFKDEPTSEQRVLLGGAWNMSLV